LEDEELTQNGLENQPPKKRKRNNIDSMELKTSKRKKKSIKTNSFEFDSSEESLKPNKIPNKFKETCKSSKHKGFLSPFFYLFRCLL